MLKKYFYLFFIFFIMSIPFKNIYAADFRNIFSITFSDFSNTGNSVIYNDSLISRGIIPGTALLCKYYLDDRKNWDNTIYTLGPIININQHHYIELTYGYGIDSNDARADYYSIELTREVIQYLAGLGFKHSAYHTSYKSNQISPFVNYNFNPKTSLWWKLFYDFDSDSNTGISNWIEGNYKINSRLSARLGFTLEDGFSELDAGVYSGIKSNSVIAGLSYQLKDNINLKYILQNERREYKNFNDDGNKHTFAVDVSF